MIGNDHESDTKSMVGTLNDNRHVSDKVRAIASEIELHNVMSYQNVIRCTATWFPFVSHCGIWIMARSGILIGHILEHWIAEREDDLEEARIKSLHVMMVQKGNILVEVLHVYIDRRFRKFGLGTKNE